MPGPKLLDKKGNKTTHKECEMCTGFLGERNISCASSSASRGQTFRKVSKVEFLALAMLPGLMAIAVTDRVFPPPFPPHMFARSAQLVLDVALAIPV